LSLENFVPNLKKTRNIFSEKNNQTCIYSA